MIFTGENSITKIRHQHEHRHKDSPVQQRENLFGAPFVLLLLLSCPIIREQVAGRALGNRVAPLFVTGLGLINMFVKDFLPTVVKPRGQDTDSS